MQQTNLDIFNDAVVSEPEQETINIPVKENIETNIFDNAVVTDVITDKSPPSSKLPKKYTYEGIKNNPNIRARAVRFAKNYLGHDNIDEDEAVDEFIEHFRQFNVNEVYAGMDYNYVSGLSTDAKEGNAKKQQELEDYRTLYTAFEQMPSFFDEEGGDYLTAAGDYFGGIIAAPSTYLSLLVPAGGKVAGQAAVATSKLAIGKLLTEGLFKQGAKGFLGTGLRANKNLIGSVVANPLKSTAIIEGTGGALQDIAAQGTMLEADLQDEYDFKQTALVTAVTAGLSVGVPLVKLKSKFVKHVEKNTGDLVKESEEAILKRTEEAKVNAKNILNKNKDLGQAVTDQLNSLNKDAIEEGKAKLGEMATKENLDASVRLAVKPEKFKQVAGALTEVLQDIGGLKKGERIMDGLRRALVSLKGGGKATQEIEENFGTLLQRYDLTYDDLGNIFTADVSDAARILQTAGQSKKEFLASMRGFHQSLDEVANYDIFGFSHELKEAQKNLAKAAKDGDVDEFLLLAGEEKGFMAGARKYDAARLAFMTSQTATTFRNMISGYARVGMDTATQALDNALAKVTGHEKLTPNSDVWSIAYGLVNKKEAALVEEIFERGFEGKARTMFRQLADITEATGAYGNHKVGRLEKISRELNAFNTISDNMFKRAAFVGNIKRELNSMYTQAIKAGKNVDEKNYNLTEIIKNGRFNDTFGTKEGKEAIDKIVQDTLYFTYQKSPDGKSASSGLAKMLIQGVHKLPFVGTALVPFPRFVVNAMRYTYEYSPLFLAFDKGARGQMLNVGKSILGMQKDELVTSYNDAAKGLIGTGMLSAGMGFRLSEHAGENWYEGRTPEGKTFDMRPFFPAAPYLFFGDIAAKIVKGEPLFKNRDTIAQAIQALTGAQFKAGLGLYALEGFFADIENPDVNVVDVIANAGSEYFGNIFSTVTIPATAGQDLYNTYLAPDFERTVKYIDRNDALSLLVNRSLQRVPANNQLQRNLEKLIGETTGYKAPKASQYATKEGKKRRVAPITRQTAGLLLNEKKNKFEAEMDRLQIRGYAKFPKTQNPEYDEMYGLFMDNFIRDTLVPFLESKQYKNIEGRTQLFDNKKFEKTKADVQREVLLRMISNVKDTVNDAMKSQKTIRNMTKKYGNYPLYVVQFERYPSNIRAEAKVAYSRKHGQKASKNDYDYYKLVQLAKQITSAYKKDIVR